MSDELDLSTPVPHIGFLTPPASSAATAPATGSAGSSSATSHYQIQMSAISSLTTPPPPPPTAPSSTSVVRTTIPIPAASIPLGDATTFTQPALVSASSSVQQPTQHGGGGKGPMQVAKYRADAKAEKAEKLREDKDRKAAKAKLLAKAKAKRASEEDDEDDEDDRSKSDDDGGVDAGSDGEADEASEADEEEEEEADEAEPEKKSKKRKSPSSSKKVKATKKAKKGKEVDDQDHDQDRASDEDDEVDGSSSPSATTSAGTVVAAVDVDADAEGKVDGGDGDGSGGGDVGAFDASPNEALNRILLVDGLKQLPLAPITRAQDELLGQGDDCAGESLDPLRILDHLTKCSVKQILLAAAPDRPLKLQIEKIVNTYGAPLFNRIGERLPRDESATTIVLVLIHLLQVANKADIDLITPHVHPVVMERVRLLQVAAAKKALAAPAKNAKAGKTGGGRGRKPKAAAASSTPADKTVQDSETTTATTATPSLSTSTSATPPTSAESTPPTTTSTTSAPESAAPAVEVTVPTAEAKEGKTETATAVAVVPTAVAVVPTTMDETEDKEAEVAVEPKYGYGLACLWMQLERFTLDGQKKELNAEIAEHRVLLTKAKATGNTSSAVNIVKEDKKVADASLKEVRKRFTTVTDMIVAFKEKVKAVEAAADAALVASGKPKAVAKVKAAGGRGRKKKT